MIAPAAKPTLFGALLLVSVAANLFLGGLVAGRFTGEAVQGLRSHRAVETMFEPLPKDKRELVRRELSAAMPEERQHLKALQAARAGLAAELAKPSPDPERIDRCFAEVRAQTTAIQANFQQAFKRAVVSLTPAERLTVVEALRRRARAQRTVPDL